MIGFGTHSVSLEGLGIPGRFAELVAVDHPAFSLRVDSVGFSDAPHLGIVLWAGRGRAINELRRPK
jgi:hypothetical protein